MKNQTENLDWIDEAVETMTDPGNDGKVINLNDRKNQKNQNQDKPTKEKGPTVEWYWTDHLRTDKNIRIVKVGLGYQLVRYERDHFEPIGGDELKSSVTKFVRSKFPESYTEGKIKSCMGVTIPDLISIGKSLDKPKYGQILIAVQNGILEVFPSGKMTLHPHCDDIWVQHYIPVSLQADIDGNVTLKDTISIENKPNSLLAHFLKSNFPDEGLRKFTQEILGDIFSPTMRDRVAIFISSGGQGKSTFLGLLKSCFQNSVTYDYGDTDQFRFQKLPGRSMYFCDELPSQIKGEDFKRINGGKSLSVKRKFLDEIEWTPDLKGVLCCDRIPSFSQQSGGIDRRICPIPLMAAKWEGSKKIDELDKKIIHGYMDANNTFHKSELEDFLHWLLNGMLAVVHRGRLLDDSDAEMPKLSLNEKLKFRRQSSPVEAFFQDLELIHGTQGVTKQEIYLSFVEYCKERGFQPKNAENFGSQLQQIFERETKKKLKESKITVEVGIKKESKAAFFIDSKSHEFKKRDYLWDVEKVEAKEKELEELAKAGLLNNTPEVSTDPIPF